MSGFGLCLTAGQTHRLAHRAAAATPSVSAQHWFFQLKSDMPIYMVLLMSEKAKPSPRPVLGHSRAPARISLGTSDRVLDHKPPDGRFVGLPQPHSGLMHVVIKIYAANLYSSPAVVANLPPVNQSKQLRFACPGNPNIRNGHKASNNTPVLGS